MENDERKVLYYRVYEADKYFEFGQGWNSGFKICVVYEDDELSYYDLDYDSDITELANWHFAEDSEDFETKEEAEAEVERLEKIKRSTCQDCGCKDATAYTHKEYNDRGRPEYITTFLCEECHDGYEAEREQAAR